MLWQCGRLRSSHACSATIAGPLRGDIACPQVGISPSPACEHMTGTLELLSWKHDGTVAANRVIKIGT